MKSQVRAGLPAFSRLQDNVAHPGEVGGYGSSAENAATMYLLTGEERYAEQASTWALHLMEEEDVRFDSYLDYGFLMASVAVVLDYCRPALDDARRKAMVDYLDRWTHEAWYDNQGSGWGREDPGNNYYLNYLQGLAFAGYALRAEKHPHAQKYLERMTREIEDRLLPYLAKRARGGGWAEGANYGQLSKRLMLNTTALIASQGGPDYFARDPFFADVVRYAVYQLQPDDESINPLGDLARDVAMTVTPYDRDYVLMAMRYATDDAIRRLARWYLDTVVPSMEAGAFAWRGGLWRDVVFAPSGEVTPRAPKQGLPRHYVAPATGFVNVRSDWSATATSFTLSAPSIVDQSHQHHDVGSFVLFKGGWQAADASTYTHGGLAWEAGAHNMVHVAGQERLFGLQGGGMTAHHRGADFFYASVDAAYAFKRYEAGENHPIVDHHRREIVYLEPDTVVTYDHVVPRDGRAVSLRLHVPKRPLRRDAVFWAQSQLGGLAFTALLGGQATIEANDDLEGGASRSFRVEVAPSDAKDARFLAVTQVARSRPPSLAGAKRLRSSDSIEAVANAGWVVVFRAADEGQLTTFDYDVPGSLKRRHVMLHLDPAQGYRVELGPKADGVTVRVRPGGKLKPSPEGVLTYVDE